MDAFFTALASGFQEIRFTNAGTVSSPLFTRWEKLCWTKTLHFFCKTSSLHKPLLLRCVQYSRAWQASISGQLVDLWHLRQVLLQRVLLGHAHCKTAFTPSHRCKSDNEVYQKLLKKGWQNVKIIIFGECCSRMRALFAIQITAMSSDATVSWRICGNSSMSLDRRLTNR